MMNATDRRGFNSTVSGSFHRHMAAITAAVHELTAFGVRVLSPADPRVVANQGEFLFVASDRVRSVRLVQDRHLESIRAADFLWLVCPDGYVGQSASMEVGFAAAAGVPILATHMPLDLTLRQYVTVVSGVPEALHTHAVRSSQRSAASILIDPHASIERAHAVLERIGRVLNNQSCLHDPARTLYGEVEDLRTNLQLPFLQ